MRVCAITNVYNEATNLPIWLKYYGSNFGLENCLIVDHGSDDGSTSGIGAASRINMPRDKFSDHRRAKFISELASSLLNIYDVVIYTDCDEILVADPAKYQSLNEFCQKMETQCATAIGLNVFQNVEREGAIDLKSKILHQRSFVQFVSPMCKSLIVREPIKWGAGFHCANLPPSFGDLFLFHLRWMDVGECLKRLTITQKIKFEHNANHHHASLKTFLSYFESFCKRRISVNFDLSKLLVTLQGSLKKEDGFFVFKEDIRSEEAFVLPDRFKDAF